MTVATVGVSGKAESVLALRLTVWRIYESLGCPVFALPLKADHIRGGRTPDQRGPAAAKSWEERSSPPARFLSEEEDQTKGRVNERFLLF